MSARPLILSTLSAASLLVLGLAGTVTPARAQLGGGTSVGQQNIASLEFQQTDARQALRELFKITGVSYTIDPMVQGTVTVSLKNVPFDTALQNLTRQVDATYRIESGVYQIVPRNQSDATPMPFGGQVDPSTFAPAMPTSIAVDGQFVYVVQRGVLTKVDKKTMKVVGQVLIKDPFTPRAPVGGGFGR